ncbi:MAG: OmpA family protein [Bacteroidota bacterium]|nr:OmpA family protein [Bacteroidota bacterium]
MDQYLRTQIKFLFICIFFISLFSIQKSFAQKKRVKTEQVKLADSNITHRVPSGEYQLYFKHINEYDFYDDPKLRSFITKADKENNLQLSLRYTELYVSGFGIRNFYVDTYYLWRLAQLYEKFGNQSKAKSLYKLVLKHHRGELKKIYNYYDSLTRMDRDYWVPIDYYYRMVDFRKDVDTLHPPKSVLINMGPEVNSKDADYGPALNPERTMLLFTSKRNRSRMEKIPNEDLFFCVGEDGYWQPAQPFSTINTDLNEGSPCLSKDGNKLYFVRCNGKDGYGNCDIYSSDKILDEYSGELIWGNVKNLGPHINSRAWDSQPSLSHTEDTLFFASDRLGGFGMSDIWFTFKTKEGDWAIPQNLGPIINTRGSEVSPFYHPTYDVLYYSSNGFPVSFGDFDIYKVRKVNGNWDEPRNIGPLINGKGSEYYFTIDSKAKDLFYAKSEEDDIKNLDLYSFPLPMEAQPLAYTRLVGSLVMTKEGDTTSISSVVQQTETAPESSTSEEPQAYIPNKGMVSIIDLDHGIEVAPKFLRPDGTFEFELINNNRYMIIIQGDDFFSVEEELMIKNDTLIRLVTKMIDYKKPMIFDRIEFEHDSWEIKPEMYKSLDLVMKFLLDNPTYKLKISGHTNSDGNAQNNRVLSEKRAVAIKDYLTDKGGIEKRRIEAVGYGSTKPLRAEVTNEDKRINRRVEFEVLKPSFDEH